MNNRPEQAARLLRRALATLPSDPPDPHRALRPRILLSLAYVEAELTGVDAGLDVLAQATCAAAPLGDPALHGVLRGQRGYILLRAGRLAQARTDLDAGLGLLEAAQDHAELCAALVNRGLVHLELHDPQLAMRDFARAAQVATAHRLDARAAIASYNLGYASLLAGDLPRALREMELGNHLMQSTGTAVPGLCLLDRARALLAAGLVTDADAALAEAIRRFRAVRAGRDQAEAELTRAHVALATGRPADAAARARAARGRFRRRGNALWELLAELALVQADVLAGRRSRRRAAAAAQLADRLRAGGLDEDARVAALLAVRLHPGVVEVPRPRPGDRIGTRLLLRLVRAELADTRGDHRSRQAELRRGLAELHRYRARFGSLDLQTATGLHGRALAELGLAGALTDGRPSTVHSWVERTRALSLRLPPICPPEDAQTAALLAELRAVRTAQREAELGGAADPALAERRGELERAVRQRSWHTAGDGVADDRPAPLGAVRAALGDGCLVSFLAVAGKLHALLATARSARVVGLGALDAVVRALRRVRADLDAGALTVISGQVRAVVRRSLAAGLSALDALLWRPVARHAGDGPVIIVPTVPLAAVPWPMLPGLRTRPVSVAPSATWWLTARDRAAVRPGAALSAPGVFAAGPGLLRADTEVRAAAAGAPATVLTGPDATADKVLTAADGSPLLHVAAHGRHEPDNPLFSAIELADGPLFGYDLPRAAALPPHVVLSACDLGLAVARPGDELLGMTAALLHTGVASVVAGVARISDAVACEVMVDYHRALRAGAPPSAALTRSTVDDPPVPLVCFGAGW
ncbi:MAG TPA: CHAT domain-containing protein [Pseudonocardiaceae bacterium]|nr:CHAT domain-containing protein [Pseudonocardiaceae bacterium]